MTVDINVTPRHALIDVPRAIVVTGFPAHTQVDIVARQHNADGGAWESVNRFLTDEQGRIDLRTAVPVSGDYAGSGAQPMGIIWSMRCLQDASPKSDVDTIATLTTEIEAHGVLHIGAQLIARTSFTQVLLADGVTRREVREQGMVGTLFTPATPGPHPAVIFLNGSGGGINEPRAALFASHGITAFALGYFKAPGLPAAISRTPLEYFSKALDWLRAEVQPANGFVAVSGQSRGGELSLLLAATYPDRVSAVIGYVPSAVLHGTLRAGAAGEAPDGIAWTLDGEALPHVWQENRRADWSAFNQPAAPGEAIRQAPAFETALLDGDAVERAHIPVERITAPVLLISGTDDGFWPSSRYSEMIVERMQLHGCETLVEHLRYDGAGHAILFPYVPTTVIARLHPVAGVSLTAGGTPLANALANESSWQHVLRFVRMASSK